MKVKMILLIVLTRMVSMASRRATVQTETTMITVKKRQKRTGRHCIQ
ncbi:hypothetical protein A2U01_0060987 [Trifolium medium]|uniref:Uncharacterized protein n=1 Tax=Trifolium medium TaxID=97028 RepID=A0A392RVY6_9FABA|nr:hypothetical protein [Trifolium medium]